MFQLLAGFQVSQTLYAVAALAVTDCLASGPAAGGGPGAGGRAHGPSLRRVLRCLASLGVFTEPSPPGETAAARVI